MRVALTMALSLLAVTPLLPGAEDAKPPRGKPPAAKVSAATQRQDEAALRASASEFAKVFNQGDAKALAAFWSPVGELVTEEGEILQGRDAIESSFAANFANAPPRKMEIAVTSIRFVGSDTAVEDGVTTSTAKAGGDSKTSGPTESSRYSVVHVRQNGKWMMASVRELGPVAPTAHERLKELEWLVGEWIDESDESIVFMSCRPTKDGSYLLNDFEVRIAGVADVSGTQRIGWDPAGKRFRSWVFDSKGGFSEGIWSGGPDRWTIQVNGVRADGAVSSATNTLTRINRDRYTWGSTNRSAGGELMDDVDTVTVVRRPPQPVNAR